MSLDYITHGVACACELFRSHFYLAVSEKSKFVFESGLSSFAAIERIYAPLERPTLLENNYQVGYNVDKDRASLTKVKNLHETGQIISYRLENHRFRLEILRPETWYH